PAEAETRAIRVSEMSAGDLVAAAAVLHSLLEPRSDPNPRDSASRMVSYSGEVTSELAKPEERMAIFEKAAELIHDLSKVANSDEARQFLDRAANLAALSVVLAHPFEDGNGRTARVLAHTIKIGFDNTEKIRADLITLGTNRTRDGFRIGSFMPGFKSEGMTPQQILEVAASLEIPLSDEQTYITKSWEAFSSPYNPAIGPVFE
ncbi:MAG TPA: Fic family protein, partial [Candidatus Saccharimonadales bacterium]|nr:Fic family protein [Candidatus Saccharimonadales bacterium]